MRRPDFSRKGGRSFNKIYGSFKRTVRGMVEQLEQRTMLTIPTSSWFENYSETNATWNYQLTTSDTTATLTDVNKGPASFHGINGYEIDATTSSGITQKGYFTPDSSGFSSEIGSEVSSSAGAITDVYTPYQEVVPGLLTAGQTVTLKDSDVNTQGTTTVTNSETRQFTLASETPSTVVVPAGTFQAYQVTQVYSASGSDGSSVFPTTTTLWFAPGYGLIKSTDDSGLTTQLTHFTGNLDHLAITVRPTKSEFGEVINPSVQLTLEDQNNNPDTRADHAVTITPTLSSLSTGTGKLTGNAVTTKGGVATFSDLSISQPGRYVLTFRDSNGRTVQSDPFTINAGTLRIKNLPKHANAGTVIIPSVEVELVNHKGEIVKNMPSLVEISGSAPGVVGDSVSGKTAELVNGLAVFKQLKFAKQGTYHLTATDGQADNAASADLKVRGLHLAFLTEPAKVGAGERIKYVLALESADNRIVNDSKDGIELTLNVIEGGTNAQLSSHADTLVRGVAINDVAPLVSINSPGKYTITAREIAGGGSTSDVSNTLPVTSKEFQVVADHLVFAQEPANTHANVGLKYVVEMRDYQNKLVPSNDGLSIKLLRVSGGAGAVLSNNAAHLVNGKSESEAFPQFINGPGTFKLSVSDVPPPGTPRAKSTISKEFTVAARK